MGGDERRRRWALVALLGLLATALRSIGLAAPWGADNFGTAARWNPRCPGRSENYRAEPHRVAR